MWHIPCERQAACKLFFFCAGWLIDARLPLVDERFAALGLDDILQALAEGVGLALVRRVEAGERGGGLGGADQPEGDGRERGHVRAHDDACCGA